MGQFVRRHLRWIVPAALCVASVVGSTQANVPNARPDEDAFDAPRRAQDEALPPQARRGTGMLGLLSPGAMDAVALSFTLPDGRTIHARRQQLIDDRARQLKTWVGTFEEQPGSLAVLGTYRGATTGFLAYGAELWEILPAPDGRHLMLYRFDDSRLPTAEPLVSPARKPTAAMSTPVDYRQSEATPEMLEAGYVHDLLVVYTPAARARYGQATLESMIHNAVQAANQAYRNSGVAITLNLVGLKEVRYQESGDMKSSLKVLQGRKDGQLERVHAMRDELGADIVTMVAEDSDSCGIAWSMRGETPGAASTAFNVVNAGCLSNQSLAHEVGHNQGNMHDRDSTTNTGAFPYSYGFRRCTQDGAGFRTIMAYACRGVARVARFSGPALTYSGQAMGVAYETDPDNSADNVRSMNNTADTVAKFRAAPGLSPSRAPERLSAWTSAPGTVVLHWFDAGDNENGVKVERSSNGIDFVQVAVLGADATNYVDNDAAAATRYYYRVRAFNGRGNSGYSDVRDVAMW
jgi:peptidyl-Asp metalloendopeptidase